MSDDIQIDISDGSIWVITLNRPQALNAITMDMAATLSTKLAEAETDVRARCIIITGAGDDAFSAGFDIKEMAGFDNDAMHTAFVTRDPLMQQIALHRLPVIAALNGKAYGAGALIAAACDFRIAAANAEFKVTAINYGSANATWSLPNIVGLPKAKHILMTGRAVAAEEAMEIGLFDKVVGKKHALEAAKQLATDICSKPPAGVIAVKQLANAAFGQDSATGWLAEHRHVLSQLGEQQKTGEEVFDAFLGAHRR